VSADESADTRSADGASRPQAHARVAIVTLGCKVNQAESEELAAALLCRGATICPVEDAEVTIVHSCCVTAEAEKKVRKAVRRALRASCGHRVVVTGCLANVDPESVSALGERVVVADRGTLADALLEAAPAEETGPGGSTAARPVPRVGEGFHTRALLKVQDGCDSACAYCIVPRARGSARSIPLRRVADEAGELVANGAREIVLTGVNLGTYEDPDGDLSDLVRAVAALGVPRIRLSSIEPEHVTDALVQTLSEIGAFCPHLHVPLQSGSDGVLSAMSRRYDAASYRRTIEHARAAIPGLAVTTDVMSGFPGETEEDHAETLALLESLGGTMSKLHVFRFSPRPGTRASRMGSRVQADVTARRATEVRDLGDALRRTYMQARMGRHAEVLVERVAPGRAEGTSRDYLKVVVERPDLQEGVVTDVEFVGIDGSRMLGA
jgi:threonylcarbamoyladenosine tRNA methylthiotransferase MtaB